MDVMRQPARLVIPLITVCSYCFFFICTMMGQASDSMTTWVKTFICWLWLILAFARHGSTSGILFSCSTKLSMKLIILINVKMPTMVGILTFISMLNATNKVWKQNRLLLFGILVFMSSWNFMFSWVEHGARLSCFSISQQ